MQDEHDGGMRKCLYCTYFDAWTHTDDVRESGWGQLAFFVFERKGKKSGSLQAYLLCSREAWLIALFIGWT